MTREEVIKALIKERKTALHENKQAFDMAIKALEQEPSEDCVSRQAVLEEIPVLWNGKGDKDYCMETLRDFVAELPPVTPTQRWIPVSERLPENDEVVLGTNSSNDLFETNTWDDCGEIKWYANGCFDVPIIAWMPLPEPYKTESEG